MFLSMDHFRFLDFFWMGFLVLFLGCPTYGSWTEFSEEDPIWCGPGRHVMREARSVELFTAGGEIRWRISDDEFLIPSIIAESGIMYLEEIGIIKRVQGFGSSFSYDFGIYSDSDVILVSVRPSVFILAKAPLSAQRRWYKNRRIFLIGTDQERGVEYGTNIPLDNDLSWFSPDLGVGIQPILPIDEDPKVVDLVDGKLLFSKRTDHWEVSRVGSGYGLSSSKTKSRVIEDEKGVGN